jgi:hypothetical protein
VDLVPHHETLLDLVPSTTSTWSMPSHYKAHCSKTCKIFRYLLNRALKTYDTFVPVCLCNISCFCNKNLLLKAKKPTKTVFYRNGKILCKTPHFRCVIVKKQASIPVNFIQPIEWERLDLKHIPILAKWHLFR